MTEIAQLSISTKIDLSGVKRDLNSIDQLAKPLGLKIGNTIGREIGSGVKSQTSFIQSALTGVVTGVTTVIAGIITNAIGGAIKAGFGAIGSSINASTELRNVTNALEFMTGSSANARNELAYLRAEGDRLNINLQTLRSSYVSLTAASRGTNLEGIETRNIFSSVAQAGRVFNLTSEQMEGALLAVGQMISKGTVQAEELRGQLGERIPGAFQIAARAMNVTTSELGDLLQKGEVLADDFLPRFARQLAEETSGGVTGALRSVSSASDELGNRILVLREQFGSAIEPAIIGGLNLMSDTLAEVGNSTGLFDSLNQKASEFRDYLEANPQIAKDLGVVLSQGVDQVLDSIVESADNLLKYLKENPQAIKEAIGYMGEFLKSVKAVADVVIEMVNGIREVNNFLSQRQSAQDQDFVLNQLRTAGSTQTRNPGSGVYGGVSLDDDQVNNARTIARVGMQMQMTPRDIQIAIATALQESSLRNLDHGDRDSLGLFQQRPSQGWGSARDVQNPEYAARAFYNALARIENRDRLPITVAAQRVQRSAYPDAYARWEQTAAALTYGIVSPSANLQNAQRFTPNFLSGAGGSLRSGSSGYTSLGSAAPNRSGNGGDRFVFPVEGMNLSNAPLTGRFGEDRGTHIHNGLDIAAGRGTNVLSPLDGVVTAVRPNNGAAGNTVEVDVIRNGQVERLRFFHLDRILAEEGQQVSAGTAIGTVGNTGRSRGNHLHFEVHRGGRSIDPHTWLQGASQGSATLDNIASGIDAEARMAEEAERAREEAAREARRLLEERRSHEQQRIESERRTRDQQLELQRREEDARTRVSIAETENPYQRDLLESQQQITQAEREIDDRLRELEDQRSDLVRARQAKIEDQISGGADYSAAINAIDEMIARTRELRSLEIEPARIEQQRELREANEALADTYSDLSTRVGDLFFQFNDSPFNQYLRSLEEVNRSHDELKHQIEDAIEQQQQLIEVEGETTENRERLANLNQQLAGLEENRTRSIERQTEAYQELNRQQQEQINQFGVNLQSELLGARAGQARRSGNEGLAADLEQQAAMLQEGLRFDTQIQSIIAMRSELGLTEAQFVEFVDLAHQLNAVNLDGITSQVNTLGSQIANGLQPIAQNFFSSFIKGTLDMKDVLGQLADMLINLAFNQIFGSLFSGLGGLFGGGGGMGGGLAIGLNQPLIPGFAEGGIVTRPMIGAIGEAGYPEAVIPLKQGLSGLTGGGENVTINVTVNSSGNGGKNIQSSVDSSTELGNTLKNAVIKVLMDESRPNGVVYNLLNN